jgi:hypothetical protein
MTLLSAPEVQRLRWAPDSLTTGAPRPGGDERA